MANANMQPGSILKGVVLRVDKDFVTVNVGLKSEGIIPLAEFCDESGQVEAAVGDEVDVALDAIEDGYGETLLSREKAKRFAIWDALTKAHVSGESICGKVTERVKGGFTVEFDGLKAFLPGSLADIRPIRDPQHLEGRELEFKIIKMDSKRNNIVVSRRAALQEESTAERQMLMENLEEGQEVKGIVKNLTDYGAFIDLGGVDGLLHITDMSWKRIRHPSELLNAGDEVKVQILKYDREKNRVSLGMKQLGDDPWKDLAQRYPVNQVVSGKVANITDYGCFVEIENGVEGLVHMSEMDWTNKSVHPNKIVQLGDVVQVMILEVEPARRRISLGIKQCVENPWKVFAERFQKGEKVTGIIKSITDFGIFLGLEGGIDGLVHLSDITWGGANEATLGTFKKGESIEAVILSIDAERERISLGLKQINPEPFNDYIKQYGRGSIVTGTVTAVNAKAAQVELADEVQGQILASDIAKEAVDNVTTVLKVGDTVTAKIVGLDKKSRLLKLSIKAKEQDEEDTAVKVFNAEKEDRQGGVTLGDILKDSIDRAAHEDQSPTTET